MDSVEESSRKRKNGEEGESSKRNRDFGDEDDGQDYENGFSTDLELAPPICSARRATAGEGGFSAYCAISDSQPILSLSNSQHLVQATPSMPPYSRSQWPTTVLPQSSVSMVYQNGSNGGISLLVSEELLQRSTQSSHSGLSNLHPLRLPVHQEASLFSPRNPQNLLPYELPLPVPFSSPPCNTGSLGFSPPMASLLTSSTDLFSQFHSPEVPGPLELSPSHPINNNHAPPAEPATNVQEAAAAAVPANGGYNARSLARRPSNSTQVVTNASSRARRSSNGGEGGEMVTAPFEWATTSRARVHSKDYLISRGINRISGVVHCKKCDQKYNIEYDLREKFEEVRSFVVKNKDSMHDRAPACWTSPPSLPCARCNQANCVKPEIPDERDSINWLFLLLGQMLGHCTLDQLKYFCKHSQNHRTGAKDRVLYLTYLGLCKQLDPEGPFDYRF